jgi:hypothetical protein
MGSIYNKMKICDWPCMIIMGLTIHLKVWQHVSVFEEISRTSFKSVSVAAFAIINWLRRAASRKKTILHQWSQYGQSEWNGSDSSDEIGNDAPDISMDLSENSASSSKTDTKRLLVSAWLFSWNVMSLGPRLESRAF